MAGTFAAGLAVVLSATPASAGTRQFVVMLAHSPKQYPGPLGGLPVGGLVNATTINKQYFDQLDPGINSFAEYWEEISYGDVTISGETLGWFDLPWAIQPPIVDPGRLDPENVPVNICTDGETDPICDDMCDPFVRHTPCVFFDMDANGQYAYGMGERFDNTIAQTILDVTGDPGGVNDGPPFPGPGSGHTSSGGQNAGKDVWKPGERFLDMDGDGKWDGFDETRNWMDWLGGDGRPDNPGPWIDLNNDGEPFGSDDCVAATTACPEGARCYLRDTDNDGNPDCCPNGPGQPGCEPYPDENACPPMNWEGPGGVDIEDCNGNLIPDAQDIADGTSRDELPFVPSADGTTCGPGPGDGVPDECQVENATTDCVEESDANDDPDTNPCAGSVVCMLLDANVRENTRVRCEYFDSNVSGVMDIVEPFENFMRRWDPCYTDPEVSSPNLNGVHWIKVYDPGNPAAALLPRPDLTCDAPMASFNYGDPSYITNNYPGDRDALIAEAGYRVLYAEHDPLGILPPGQCTCTDPITFAQSPCEDGVEMPDGTTLDGACVAGFHADYNPADSWTNTAPERGPGGVDVFTTKMRALPGSGGQAEFATSTPEPGTMGALIGLGEQAWYPQAYLDRYNNSTCYNADGSAADACSAPEWPQGFDPNGDPVPGGPAAGRPTPNTLEMVPFTDPDEETYDPAANRRFFKANFGGVTGLGDGWVDSGTTRSCGGELAPLLIFETGPLGAFGFADDCNAAILPEEVNGPETPGIFFDGFVEHDDLPSSKYHQAGEQRLGEVTSPFNGAIWGQDIGDHNPGTPSPGGGDQIIPAAGPYATEVHGNFGRDAGNVLLMELLTWRTAPPFNNGMVWESWYGTHHPYAGPGTEMEPNENLGFRDYNLDGLVDQGEVRNVGSENYIVDSVVGSPNNGTNSEYPFNRQRMLEDCMEILDFGTDFDEFVDTAALDRVTCPNGIMASPLPVQFLQGGDPPPLDDFVIADGILSGIVLLPVGAHVNGDFIIAPSFYPIHNEDGLNDPLHADATFPRAPNTPQISWNLFVHDLVISVGVEGESPGGEIPNTDFQTAYSAHEYLHSWEGFPDVYDYSIFNPSASVVCPVGRWDIMASGGLVHPMPLFKEKPCTEWIDPIDLTRALTPGVETTLTLPPAEFVRSSYYFLENENRLGERYYLWSAGSGFDDPFAPSGGFPGAGMLVMHTDVGSNPDGLPAQQQIESHPTYLIVQADGLGELEAGTDCGDAGDPWPGSTENTSFNFDTVPAATFWSQNSWTGLDVSSIVPDGQGSAQIVISWQPTNIPSLKFIDPPGGESVDVEGSPSVIYQVRVKATDVYGGTWIRIFYTPDVADLSIDPDGGNYIGMIHKTTPGTNQLALDWDILGVPDSQYFLFAELIPDSGADGDELSVTTPRPGRNNVGNGALSVDVVDTNEIVTAGSFGGMVGGNPSAFTALADGDGTPINFVAAGVQVGDQVNLALPLNIDQSEPFLRTVTGFSGNTVLQLSAPIVPSGAAAQFGPWQVTRADRPARSETWALKLVGIRPEDGFQDWRINSTLTQPEPPDDAADQDPWPHMFVDPETGVGTYTSVGGEVTFTLTNCTAENQALICPGASENPNEWPPPRAFDIGDMWTFTTTGVTATSQGVTILGGVISETPVAVILATPLAGQAPLAVEFDGRLSFDPNNGPLTYEWDFGDGVTGNGSVVTHTFTESLTFTVTLKVTSQLTGLFGEGQVDIEVINNTPNAMITAAPSSGPGPLTVSFSGAQSSDLETPSNELIYQWDFGDGTTANESGEPGILVAVEHVYFTDINGDECNSSHVCTLSAALTVTDAVGQQDTDFMTITVGNTNPVPNMFHTSLEGPAPHQVTFNAIQSFDAEDTPAGVPLMVTWHWGDGSDTETWPQTGPPGSPDGGVPHTFEAVGAYQVTATVEDSLGGVADWPGVTVTVNEATAGASQPQAIFTVNGEFDAPQLAVGEAFTADGTASFDRPCSCTTGIASYTWDFGDGTPVVSGPIAVHTYTQPGGYTISLTVADNETPPNTHTSNKPVVVVGDAPPPPSDIEPNQAPTPSLVASTVIGVAGETIFSFDGSDSVDPDGADETATLDYTWDFGDGSPFAAGATVTHVFMAPGTYTVRLTVTDVHNAFAIEMKDVSVTGPDGGANSPPLALIATGPTTTTVGVPLRFNGAPSYDPDGQIVSYLWTFSDSNDNLVFEQTGASVEQAFNVPDTYSVRLLVTDNDGATAEAGPILVDVAAAGTAPSPTDVGPAQPTPVPNSADQRPNGMCGVGMLTGLLGSLLGLSMMLVTRRRRMP